jgi:hypothetical protein
MSFTRLAVLSVLALLMFTVSSNANAECLDVNATVGEQTFSTCGESPTHTCITGHVSGTIDGKKFSDSTYVFEGTFAAAFPGGGVSVFRGTDTITTEDGDTIFATERGLVDFSTAVPGDPRSSKFTAMLIVTGGEGVYENASGVLFVSGDNYSLLMHGELCTPDASGPVTQVGVGPSPQPEGLNRGGTHLCLNDLDCRQKRGEFIEYCSMRVCLPPPKNCEKKGTCDLCWGECVGCRAGC